jgi:flagella basal body P-ring formation protein FlgA
MRILPPLLAFLLLLLAQLLAVVGHAATLKPMASLTRDTVVLGDLFADLPNGVSPDLVVGRAPSPGQKIQFGAAQLSDIAAAAQLDWTAPDRFVKAEVERASHLITRDQIMLGLRPALVEHGMPSDAVVTLDNEMIRLVTGAERPSTVAIDELTYDPTLGRFQAMLSTPAGEPDAVHARISGRAVQTILLPVPSRPIAAGEIIRVTDIQLMRIRMDRTGNTVIGDPDRLIGRTAKRMLAAQEPIQVSAIAPTIMVPKNSIAIARIISGRILITMEGKALDDGAQGDTIRVANPRSNKTVQGIVTGPGEVTLIANTSLAAR